MYDITGLTCSDTCCPGCMLIVLVAAVMPIADTSAVTATYITAGTALYSSSGSAATLNKPSGSTKGSPRAALNTEGL